MAKKENGEFEFGGNNEKLKALQEIGRAHV